MTPSTRHTWSSQHRRWPLFVPFALLAVLGLFVLEGAAAGVVLLVAFLAFLGACIVNLRGERVVGGKYGPLGL